MDRNTELAEERTMMANQRTFLAFIRTALMGMATGITFIKVFQADSILVVLGWILIPVSMLTFIVGLIQYIRIKKRLRVEE